MIIKEVKIDTPKKRQRRKPSRFQQSPDKHLVKNAIRAARNEFFLCLGWTFQILERILCLGQFKIGVIRRVANNINPVCHYVIFISTNNKRLFLGTVEKTRLLDGDNALIMR